MGLKIRIRKILVTYKHSYKPPKWTEKEKQELRDAGYTDKEIRTGIAHPHNTISGSPRKKK